MGSFRYSGPSSDTVTSVPGAQGTPYVLFVTIEENSNSFIAFETSFLVAWLVGFSSRKTKQVPAGEIARVRHVYERRAVPPHAGHTAPRC